eukprot:UN03145
MNHHQSPHLTYIKQLSLNKQHSLPRFAPLNKSTRAKSAGFMTGDSHLQLRRYTHTNSFGKSMAKHVAISPTPDAHGKTHSLELSNNLSTTFSGIFAVVNAANSISTPVTGTNSKVNRDSNTLTVTDNFTSIGSVTSKNKLSLIRELPKTMEIGLDKKMSVITPPDMTPVVSTFEYPDIEMISGDEEEEVELEEMQDKKEEIHKEEEIPEFTL